MKILYFISKPINVILLLLVFACDSEVKQYSLNTGRYVSVGATYFNAIGSRYLGMTPKISGVTLYLHDDLTFEKFILDYDYMSGTYFRSNDTVYLTTTKRKHNATDTFVDVEYYSSLVIMDDNTLLENIYKCEDGSPMELILELEQK